MPDHTLEPHESMNRYTLIPDFQDLEYLQSPRTYPVSLSQLTVRLDSEIKSDFRYSAFNSRAY